MQQFYDGMKQGCVDILSYLDTLEVKEVDLDKELNEYCSSEEYSNVIGTGKLAFLVAKHFFELGLKTQKGK